MRVIDPSSIGIIPVFKPKGPTSHDIIGRLRRITGIRKIGHAGTLDPKASGVLVVAIGREATKRINLEVQKEKEYEAVITLGQTSTTDDEEGEKELYEVKQIPAIAQIQQVLTQFIGKIDQIPPVFSAIKIHGQPAYKTARKGKILVLEARKIHIKKIELVSYQWPELAIKVTTGPGVYIRSLARDIGEKLGTGGYLKALSRTRVGEYSLDKAYHLPSFPEQRIENKEA